MQTVVVQRLDSTTVYKVFNSSHMIRKQALSLSRGHHDKDIKMSNVLACDMLKQQKRQNADGPAPAIHRFPHGWPIGKCFC